MKIIKLTANNVKRLRAVEITPDGNTVVVSGRNGQGKTSVLDAIAYALGGKDVICKEPIRRGEKSAEVVCDLGDFIVRRKFTAEGTTTVTVEGKDGARFPQPQRKLDDLIGSLSFDPLAFSRMDGNGQSETLRKLLGLDFSAVDGKRTALYAERTEVNRDGKQLAARFDALPPVVADAPGAELSSAEIMADMDAAQAVRDANTAARDKARAAADVTTRINNELASAEAHAADMADRLTKAQSAVAELRATAAAALAKATELHEASKALNDPDLQPFKDRIASLESTNRVVRANATHAAMSIELEAARAKSAALTAEIQAIDDKKQADIAAASFPVDGLGFDGEGGVTLNALPFDQASSAEQLRASVSIGLAMNPGLRVLLIKDGSLLDEQALAALSGMADELDAQLWIERVEDGGATVVIEDGSVAS